MAAQEQALRTKWEWSTIDKVEGEDGKCRICGVWFETVKHVTSGCEQLAKKQYLIRHNKMGSRIHWELCRKYGIEWTEKQFNHIPSSVCSTKDKQVEIYWDCKIEVGKGLEHNKPDVFVVDKASKKWIIVDFSVPWDANVKTKEEEKCTRYAPLATESRSIHKVKTEIIPFVVGALSTVPKRLPDYLKALGVPDVIGCLQTAAHLGTQRILKNTLSL